MEKPNKEGLCPIVLRIIKDRKSKIITLPVKCKKEQWNEAKSELTKECKNYKQVNIILSEKKIQANKIIYDFELEGIDFTLTQFEEAFLGKKDINITLKAYWEEKISDLIDVGRTGSARAYKDTMVSFFKFNPNKQLMFRDITVEMLDKYEAYMRKNKRGSSDGGIGVKMRQFRALYRDAIRKGIVNEKYDPFKVYKVSRLKSRPDKRALTRDEVFKIENLDLVKYPHLKEARDLFVFSYFTRGMNFYDIMKLRWKDIDDRYITYTRSKTKGNFKLEIIQPLREIIESYRILSKTGYVFPILLSDDLTPTQLENRKAKKLKKFNKDLKEIALVVGINKVVTSYVARHSFATNVRDAGGSVEKISQAMGHSDVSITMSYLEDFENADMDALTRTLIREPQIDYLTTKGAA